MAFVGSLPLNGTTYLYSSCFTEISNAPCLSILLSLHVCMGTLVQACMCDLKFIDMALVVSIPIIENCIFTILFLHSCQISTTFHSLLWMIDWPRTLFLNYTFFFSHTGKLTVNLVGNTTKRVSFHIGPFWFVNNKGQSDAHLIPSEMGGIHLPNASSYLSNQLATLGKEDFPIEGGRNLQYPLCLLIP